MLFLWAQLPGPASRADLEALPVTRPPTSVVVGGPGWDGVAPGKVWYISPTGEGKVVTEGGEISGSTSAASPAVAAARGARDDR